MPTWRTRSGTRRPSRGTRCTTRTITLVSSRSRRAGIRATCSITRCRFGSPDEGRDELRIGRRELQRPELGARDPSHLLTEQRPRDSAEFAREKMELDAAVVVVMDGRDDLVTHR